MFLHKLNLFLNIYFLRGAPQLKFPIFHACLLNQNCQFSLKYFNQFFTEKPGAGLNRQLSSKMACGKNNSCPQKRTKK